MQTGRDRAPCIVAGIEAAGGWQWVPFRAHSEDLEPFYSGRLSTSKPPKCERHGADGMFKHVWRAQPLHWLWSLLHC
jgi:hypothetical protein